MMTGTVKFFVEEKNYGFIQPNDGGPDVMFHATALDGMMTTLKAGQWVQMPEVIETPRGPKALKVSLCGKRGEHERKNVIPFGSDKNGTEDRII